MNKPMIRRIEAMEVMPATAGKPFAQTRARTNNRALVPWILAALVALCTIPGARAQSGITMGDLNSMAWQIAISGTTACGRTSMMVTNYGLVPPGGGFIPGGLFADTSGCGFSSSYQPFEITSFNPTTGSGTAILDCGQGCFLPCAGQVNCWWTFNIQVTPYSGTFPIGSANIAFNLVDVADNGNRVLGSNNVLAGIATPQINVNFFPMSYMYGQWQIALVGNTGCGQTVMLFTGSLNGSPTATGPLTASSGCGSSKSTQTFTINTWNPQGYAIGNGTANLSCGVGCGWDFEIQEQIGQVFTLVDVTNGGNNVLAGTAVFVPQGQTITVSQLARPWQIALVGNTGCGQTSMLFTGSLNASGTAAGTLTGSSGCGKSSSPQTFTITSLNANGSGTANLSCGSGCGWNFNIQVAPDEQIFNLVDVSNGGANVLAGTAIAGSGS